MHAARSLISAVPVALALAVPATAASAPADLVAHASAATTIKLKSVTSPPRAATAGQRFTLKGTVTNRRITSQRVTVQVSLRRTKTSSPTRVGTKTLNPIRAGRSAGYSINVKLPSTLAAGTYYVRTCTAYGKRSTVPSTACRFSERRIKVTPAQTGSIQASQAPATAGATTPATPASPAPTAPPAQGIGVLIFHKGAAPDAIDAVTAAAEANDYDVDVTEIAENFTENNLKRYQTVVFLNTTGDVLNAAQQSAFEAYHKDGGGFLALGSAIGTEPGWAYMDSLLGTRAATGPVSGRVRATIKVADRVHDASKTLPEYWRLTDAYYNYASNVRGLAHVLATVDETTYNGGSMGFDHPIMWCKDVSGGRAFYTGVGNTPEARTDARLIDHLSGALAWTSGLSDPEYSDCGATVLANYQQTKLSAPPNVNEPIGFDQLPDGRIIQTTRDGRVRLHDAETGRSTVILDLRANTYTHSEDGMYGPAIDNDFATNKWVYLYYAPLNMEAPYPAQSPTGANIAAPTTAADPSVWDAYRGYFQLSRFKFVEGSGNTPPSLDIASEQKIMKVENNRGACCHVAGDIDFDRHNNLWLTTGDDTPSGGGNSGGFSPHNDQKTNESHTLRVNSADGGTFTVTFQGQTTAPIAYNATAAAIQSALEALAIVDPGDVLVTGNTPVNTGNLTVAWRGRYTTTNITQTANGAGLTGTSAGVSDLVAQEGDYFQAPFVDARRTALNTNDLRGKVLRIKVADDGSYTSPAGNLFAAGTAQTRPEIYAMGFRNPFRIQVDENDVAYITDYSPDSTPPEAFRGPSGTGRVEIVRKPANYGWPLCYRTDLPYYRWDFNTSTTLGTPYECDGTGAGPQNTSRWNTGLQRTPPITNPDIHYTFQQGTWGTPCFGSYNRTPAVPCANTWPELGNGGVGPHGATKYNYDPDNPSETKFPPYYDESVFFGEFTRDYLKEIKLDEDGKVLKINNLLDCGAANVTPAPRFECDNPMDMQFGKDGSFYLLTYGDGFFAQNPDAGMYRWDYTAGEQSPRAVISATPTSGTAPLRVQFSSEGSRDPDENDSIRYEWDFDGNGTVDSADANPVHTYTQNGTYTAILRVVDSSGKSDRKTTTIVVGNTAPTVVINTPVDGDFFAWGERIPYTVTVTDPEDGTIDCSRVVTTFVLIHDTHGHGEDQQTGCTGTLQTLAEDASHGGYIAGGISVSYTDAAAGGQAALTTTTQHVIQQRRQQPEFANEAVRGLQFPAIAAAANEPDPGGGQAASAIDPGDYFALNNRYYLGNMNKQITIRYAGGSANNTAGNPRMGFDVRLDSPTGPIAGSGTLVSTGANNNTYTSQTFPLDFTGSHRLYLVFRQVNDLVPTGMGLINWVEFSGPGWGRP